MGHLTADTDRFNRELGRMAHRIRLRASSSVTTTCASIQSVLVGKGTTRVNDVTTTQSHIPQVPHEIVVTTVTMKHYTSEEQ